MKLTNLKVNHLKNPLGFSVKNPSFSFQVEESTGTHLKSARIRVSRTEDMTDLVYDSGERTDISSLSFIPEQEFEGGIRYYWDVCAEADNGDTGISSVAWFEGGCGEEEWSADWIASPLDKEIQPVMYREFTLDAPVSEVVCARLYITGLGVYEAGLNGEKAGEEYLAPFYNDYRFWIQYQTYDVTQLLCPGENVLSVMLGDGWYKGRFSYLDEARVTEIYGDKFLAAAQLLITYKDGSQQKITTDENWKCLPSPVLFSNIYDGEVYDANRDFRDCSGKICARAKEEAVPVSRASAPKAKLTERLSVPVTIHERLRPVSLLMTPAGEQVLDFGQEITGWVEFDCKAEKGTRIYLQYGEILQDGNFYRDNLRTAKAEFTYICDGSSAHVRPHFTFYGFRYVKVTGMTLTRENLDSFAFEACAVYSDLERTGRITTANEKVNRLIENTLWGQKGNFLDVPTDCPQRDERLGWTGDAQVFCQTASYHMDTAAFYRKYLKDMRYEQRINQGAVPFVVPDVLSVARENMGQEAPDMTANTWGEAGSCAWGDAATIIPWTLYQFYGDTGLLAETYENMKQWTDFIIHMDETYCGGGRLWQVGFHFADWLALDNPDKDSCFGRTDPYYVASVYYLYSSLLTARAAAVLGKKEDEAYYGRIAQEVRDAIRKEYITPGGRVAIDTQTALVLAIYFDIIPEEFMEKTASRLKKMLQENGMHLNTGFVGTAYLCQALTKAGLVKEAYTLLLQEDYPSWLYEVNMGATTVWERWNSVLPDGKISGTGMNSLNHYAYGAVSEWIYRSVSGIAPDETAAGFKKAVLAPCPDRRLGWVKGEFSSAAGVYESEWAYEEDGIRCQVRIPFDCTARFIVPDGMVLKAVDGAEPEAQKALSLENVKSLTLEAGSYQLLMQEA